jgi:hypothetical protein
LSVRGDKPQFFTCKCNLCKLSNLQPSDKKSDMQKYGSQLGVNICDHNITCMKSVLPTVTKRFIDKLLPQLHNKSPLPDRNIRIIYKFDEEFAYFFLSCMTKAFIYYNYEILNQKK